MQKSPLAGIDTNLLVALDAILVDENVGKAAQRIGLSASAMSHTLARLRALFDDPILVRSGQRMVATARGRQIRGPLREAVALLASAIADSGQFHPKNEERALRLSAIDFAQNHILPNLIATLRKEAPKVDVLVSAFAPTAVKELTSGDLDLVLGMARAGLPLRQEKILDEPFVSVARKGHPALSMALSAKDFAELPHVLVSGVGRGVGAVDRALAKEGLSRRVAVVVPSFTAAAIVVASSDMVLTGAEREAQRLARSMPIQLFSPPVPLVPFRLVMFWHERDDADPFHSWVRARLSSAIIA